jgi:hypothetical protein
MRRASVIRGSHPTELYLRELLPDEVPGAIALLAVGLFGDAAQHDALEACPIVIVVVDQDGHIRVRLDALGAGILATDVDIYRRLAIENGTYGDYVWFAAGADGGDATDARLADEITDGAGNGLHLCERDLDGFAQRGGRQNRQR